MDAELDRRWRVQLPPFTGATLTHRDYVPIRIARTCALRLALLMGLDTGQSTICCIYDWHEHDGYVSQASVLSWTAMERHLSSDELLISVCPDDTYVRLAYVTGSCDFYLRIHVPRNDERSPGHGIGPMVTDSMALLDITCSDCMVDTIREVLLGSGMTHIEVHSAGHFFDSSYGRTTPTTGI